MVYVAVLEESNSLYTVKVVLVRQSLSEFL